MLNIATEASHFREAYSARFIAKVVFPIDGLPATIIKSPPCSPVVFSSNSLKPVAIPVTGLSFAESSSIV